MTKYNDKTHAQLIAEREARGSRLGKNITPIGQDNYFAEVVKASGIVPKCQPWFWHGIIPLDTTTLFAGYGGIGKSLLLLFMAAYTSNGNIFSAGGAPHQLIQGGVIILSGEDDFEYQLTPKLLAANANMDKIYLLKMMKAPGKPTALLDLDSHLALLEKTIENAAQEGNPIKLIIIDPVQYFTGDMKDYINTHVCRFIASLNELAKKHSLAVVMNKHLRKSKGGGDVQSAATDAVSGSSSWTTSPRSCWLIHPHPTDDNKVLFADLKANLRKKGMKSYSYQIEKTFVTYGDIQIETTRIFWDAEMVDLSADEALNTVKIPAIEQAIRTWIVKFLIECNKKPDNGAMFSAHQLAESAIEEGYKKPTYYRVRAKMIEEGIISEVMEGRNKKIVMIKLNDPEMHS